jgi:hypothetical protein
MLFCGAFFCGAFFCGALFCGVASGPALAQAPSAEEQLGSIRDELRRAGFRSAATQVEAYLLRTDLSAAQRNQGLEIDAIVSLARRDEARASRALSELYRRDPAHRLGDPDASPVVQGAFARAREAAASRPVALETTSAAFLGRGQPRVAVRVGEGLDRIHELRIHVRSAGTARFAAVVVQPEPDGTASASLPLGPDRGVQTFEVFVEALAPSGAAIGSIASADQPLRIEVAAEVEQTQVVTQILREEPAPVPSRSDITGEWWFWTLIGVAVAGAGVGVGVGVAASQPRSPDGSLGNVNLPLVAF